MIWILESFGQRKLIPFPIWSGFLELISKDRILETGFELWIEFLERVSGVVEDEGFG